MVEIHSVNLELLENANKREKDKLFDGLTKTGFFYLSGHGISTDLIEKVENISKVFFGYSKTERQKLLRHRFPDSKLVHTGNAFCSTLTNGR